MLPAQAAGLANRSKLMNAGLSHSPAGEQCADVERNALPGSQGADLGEVFLLELGKLAFAQLRDQAAKAGIPDHAPPGFGIVEKVADVVPLGFHIAQAGAGVQRAELFFGADVLPGERGRRDAVALDAFQKKVDIGRERVLGK
jgi:hypothetical protein